MKSSLLCDRLKANLRLQELLYPKYKRYIDTYVNPNMRHTLRPYQEGALINLMYLQDKDPVTVDFKYSQLMFNMATGSGKTDLMVAIMLYMYQVHHYQDFMYTIGSNDVLEKTKANFTSPWSSNYLFNNPVSMDGRIISIRAVNRFPLNPDPNVIYVCMKSIEELDIDLNNPKENEPTESELGRQKIVILADEAHHYNATTKEKEKNNISGSWEDTLNEIKSLRPDNRQFEFTATINLNNNAIRNKYVNKIVFKYDLDEFMAEKYSKQVYWTRARNSDIDKMFMAILMSEYRVHLASKLRIPNFKPIVLFKSSKIKESHHNKHTFIKLIDELDSHKLRGFINKELKIIDPNQDKMLYIVFNYWANQDFYKIVHELQSDFDKKTIIDANSKKEIVSRNYLNLNTLDSIDNPFRVIFEVNKLNEGWNVLNLYDIVRLGKGSTSTKKTDSEAQLIGRGARYYPFHYKYRKGSSYKRCFDNEFGNHYKYRILESLFYYTFNDSKYIKHLRKSFDKIKLPVHSNNDSHELSTTVKRAFLKNDVYKQGNLYANVTEKLSKNNIHSLKDLGIDINAINKVDLSNTIVETNLSHVDDNIASNTQELRVVHEYLSDNPKLVKKAMARTKDKYHFYRLDGLSKYLPIKSLHEFIFGKQWLGGIRLDAVVDLNVNQLTLKDKLRAVQLFLEQVRHIVIKNSNKSRGTNLFYSMPVRKVVHDYSKQVPNYINKVSNYQAHIEKHSMRGHSWFVYNDAIVDGLEWQCINMIHNIIPEIQTKYNNIYLIRNDEKSNNRIQLHDFRPNASHYDAYLPDFILYMNSKQHQNIVYEFYLEPKGPNLFNDDEDQNLNHNDVWKENLLKFIRPENIKFRDGPTERILGIDSNVKLFGLKFYIPGDSRGTEQQLSHILKINPDKDLLRPTNLKK